MACVASVQQAVGQIVGVAIVLAEVAAVGKEVEVTMAVEEEEVVMAAVAVVVGDARAFVEYIVRQCCKFF